MLLLVIDWIILKFVSCGVERGKQIFEILGEIQHIVVCCCMVAGIVRALESRGLSIITASTLVFFLLMLGKFIKGNFRKVKTSISSRSYQREIIFSLRTLALGLSRPSDSNTGRYLPISPALGSSGGSESHPAIYPK